MKAKDITFNVTDKDIDEGIAHSAPLCPAARAIGRRLKPSIMLSVGRHTLTLMDRSLRGKWWTPLPLDVSEFIRDFDDNIEVCPLSFTLSIPAQYLK